MAFKLVDNGGRDWPILWCDVCGNRIGDLWNDLASGTRGTAESPGTVVIHHAACPTTHPLHMKLRDFLALVCQANVVGDVAVDGAVAETRVSLPVGGGFEE